MDSTIPYEGKVITVFKYVTKIYVMRHTEKWRYRSIIPELSSRWSYQCHGLAPIYFLG
jgi:hypothetical protein